MSPSWRSREGVLSWLLDAPKKPLMDPSLHEALRNPMASFTAGGRRPERRPSLKKANGMRRFGAAVMLGAALLSPLQSVMANAPSLQEQRVEQVQTVESRQSSPTEASIKLHQMEAELITDYAMSRVDVLGLDAQSTEGQKALHDFSQYARHGLSMSQEGRQNMEESLLVAHGRAEVQRQELDQYSPEGQAVYRQTVESAARALGYAAPQGWNEARAEVTVETAASQVGQEEAKQAYSSWAPRKDEYESRASWQTADPYNATGAEAHAWNSFSQLVMGDAYTEISKGHSLENPSARLMDVCRQVQKVDAQAPGFNTHPHREVVFETCEAKGMEFAVKVDNLKEYAVGGVAVLGAAMLKGIGVAAQLTSGAMAMDRFAGTSLLDRRRRRNEGPSGVGPDPSTPAKPSQVKLG